MFQFILLDEFVSTWPLLDQATPVGEQEKLESLDAYDTGASESQLGSQVGIASFAMDTKSNSIFSDFPSYLVQCILGKI